jgi:hypothetical protein
VSVRHPEYHNGVASLHLVAVDDPVSPAFADNVRRFVDHVFYGWNFRKLYIESVLSADHAMFDQLRDQMLTEGTLRRHTFIDGDYRDAYVHVVEPDR